MLLATSTETAFRASWYQLNSTLFNSFDILPVPHFILAFTEKQQASILFSVENSCNTHLIVKLKNTLLIFSGSLHYSRSASETKPQENFFFPQMALTKHKR